MRQTGVTNPRQIKLRIYKSGLIALQECLMQGIAQRIHLPVFFNSMKLIVTSPKNLVMKQVFIFSVCIMLSVTAFCESKIDSILQKKIISMFAEDQKWRSESLNLINDKKSVYDEATINKNMGRADSLNMIEAKKIIDNQGFPGYDLVGEDGSNGFWAIIQHCDGDVAFQQKALTLMSKQVERHNASGENYALLQDRVLINQGHKQLYGTQVRLDLKTHHAKPLPIQDSLNVDVRRKAVGLSPLGDYLKLFDRK